MSGTITFRPGDSLNIVLPSGKVVNIEATADTGSIVVGNRVLLSESLDTGEWANEWLVSVPNEADGLNDQVFLNKCPTGLCRWGTLPLSIFS